MKQTQFGTRLRADVIDGQDDLIPRQVLEDAAERAEGVPVYDEQDEIVGRVSRVEVMGGCLRVTADICDGVEMPDVAPVKFKTRGSCLLEGIVTHTDIEFMAFYSTARGPVPRGAAEEAP